MDDFDAFVDDVISGKDRPATTSVQRVNADRVVLVGTEQFVHPGVRVSRTLSMITTHRVEGVQGFDDFKMVLRDGFGGRSATAEKYFARMRDEVHQELRTVASARGAQAVVAVRIYFGEISHASGQMFYIWAEGTPVVLERVSSEDEPI